jgi:hypothetical protein
MPHTANTTVRLIAPLYHYLRSNLLLPTGDDEIADNVLTAAKAVTQDNGESAYELGVTSVSPHGTGFELGRISLALSNLRYALAEGRLSGTELRQHGITPEQLREAHCAAYDASAKTHR